MRIIIYSLECQRENGAGYDDGVHGVPDVAEVGPGVEDEAKVQDLQKKRIRRKMTEELARGGSVVQTGMEGISHTRVLRATDGSPSIVIRRLRRRRRQFFIRHASPLVQSGMGLRAGQGGRKKK